MCSYFFKDVEKASNYIFSKLSNPTPIKIQKSLYFIWSFYAATYGDFNSNQSEMAEMETYPKELFDAKFEAWKYGPVIEEVWVNSKQGLISEKFDENKDVFVENENLKNEIFAFIDNLISQIDGVNDFGLVDRSHMDESWSNRYKEGTVHCPMDNEEIKEEYKKYVKQQSKN